MNANASVLYRCIGDLSTMQCKRSSKGLSQMVTERGGTCVPNPKEAQKSLLNRATVLDTYVGWIAASWVTFFTKDATERETHIVRITEWSPASMLQTS